MGLFKKKPEPDKDFDAIIARLYGDNADDMETARMLKDIGFTAEQTRQSLMYLHGASNSHDIPATTEQLTQMAYYMANQIAPVYTTIKTLYDHPAIREELIMLFSVLSAASTEVNENLLDALNTIMYSDNTPLSKENITSIIINMGLSVLIFKRKYSAEEMLSIQSYESNRKYSKIISDLMISEMSKKEKRMVFNLFSMLLMGVGGMMENGSTSHLFYVVLNNTLLTYYDAITLWDKKGVSEDCWSYLKLVNIKMHEYD